MRRPKLEVLRWVREIEWRGGETKIVGSTHCQLLWTFMQESWSATICLASCLTRTIRWNIYCFIQILNPCQRKTIPCSLEACSCTNICRPPLCCGPLFSAAWFKWQLRWTHYHSKHYGWKTNFPVDLPVLCSVTSLCYFFSKTEKQMKILVFSSDFQRSHGISWYPSYCFLRRCLVW